MESKRVPKIGETWRLDGGPSCVLARQDVMWLQKDENLWGWTYVFGPSDAPAEEPRTILEDRCHKDMNVARPAKVRAAYKDIPLEPSAAPTTAPESTRTEAARGGEAAVSRADTMAGCTESDMRPNWPALTHAGCSRSVACNVCVPPVKRVPWVDSLPVDWWLADAT